MLVEKYRAGATLNQLAEFFNSSNGTISRHLKLCGQETLWNGCGNHLRNKFNENFFGNIDSHEKSYALGFIFADGNVSTSSNQITIAINKKDFVILKFISDAMEYSGNFCEWRDTIKLQVSSKMMKSDLIRLGCTPRKTHSLKFPTIPPEFINSFVLGYLDGDGYISKKGDQVAIAGTESFCLSLKRVAEQIGAKGYCRIISTNNKTNVFKICSKENIIKFLDWCYKDIKVLDRKFVRYKNMKTKCTAQT